jgi:hypothetical protein
MRDTAVWRKKLDAELKPQWPRDCEMRRREFMNVEFGLRLIEELVPDGPADSLPALLTGYPFALADVFTNNIAELQKGRRLLTYFGTDYQWKAALRRYRKIDERFRLYEVDEELKTFRRKPVTVAANRLAVYSDTASDRVPYRRDSMRWAEAGRYRLPGNGVLREVQVPTDLVFEPPASHDVETIQEREPIVVSMGDLKDTARWMDARSQRRNWEKTITRLQLDVATTTGLQPSQTLTIDGLTNVIGMLSSGKSTLMDVLTVWAARNDLNVTIVVDDVITALNRAQLFHDLGLTVAPVLGRTNRERHLNRLHDLIDEGAGNESPFSTERDHIGFKWLSTTCPLKGLMPFEDALAMKGYPCSDLLPILSNGDSETKPCACPMYSRCPVHNAQRELVDAKIWVATPAGLVFAGAATQVNQERVRYLELACQRSDLMIVDEADRVQMQLDSIFSPTETLVSPEGGWLDRLQQAVTDAKARSGRRQLGDPAVAKWTRAHHNAQGATDRVAAILQQDRDIREWVGKRDYFTGWLLLNRLANELIAGREESQQSSPESVSLPATFQQTLDDMARGRFDHELSNFVLRALATADDEELLHELSTWLDGHHDFSGPFDPSELKLLAKKLEFSLLTAFLQSRLNEFIRDWKVAEDPLKLNGDSSSVFFRPPRDYEAIIPAAPMGNVLAFQHLPADDDSDQAGELRFLRCMGVGRWMLLNLPNLFVDDGVARPNVMLLSGTSWAGESPSYDIQTPVNAVLRSPTAEVDAVRSSHFEFLPFCGSDGKAIKVSGCRGSARLAALREIVRQLCEKGRLGQSKLERKWADLGEQKAILLIVGSYVEAEFVRETIQRLRPEWAEQVVDLVPDDNEWNDSGFSSSIRRGQVDQLRTRNARILVAPLLAIERGHNILNENDVALLGAAYFLVRMHPPPDDISFAIQSINRWAVRNHGDTDWLRNSCGSDEPKPERIASVFRRAAYQEWKALLRLPMIYRTLPANKRRAFAWNQLVSMWQVIGRLIRNGQKAEVYFCDAAFAPQTVDGKVDTPATSLLVGMLDVLRPYFDAKSSVELSQQAIATALYEPLHSALKNIQGVIHE